MNTKQPIKNAAVTLTKMRQQVDNQLKTTAVLRRWNDGKLDIRITENYDPAAPVYCETAVSDGPIGPLREAS